MSLLLALDASGPAISVAVLRDGTLLAHHQQALARGHAERLPPALAACMAAAGSGFAALAAIAVTIGPGSFTGIRVGLAAARGLGFALGIPVLGVTTLDAVAHGLDPAERAGRPVLALIDSKRADVFAQRFGPDLAPLDAPRALPLAAAAKLAQPPLIVTGDAATMIAAAAGLVIAPAAPDARIIARLAAARWALGEAMPAAPLYLRPPDATVPEAGGRLRR
jgi:tRNA threonylcarbamoyladenosine biosynthesis protein TsaB